MTPTSASCLDLFALIGSVAFVLGSLVPGYLMGGNPIVEVVEAYQDDRVHRTSSEAPRRTDGTFCACKGGASIAGACACS